MINYDLLKEQIQQIDENYPYEIPTWLISLITVLCSFLIAIIIVASGIAGIG